MAITDKTIIVIKDKDGIIWFFGTQLQFKDCFFDNADEANIRGFAKEHDSTIEFYPSLAEADAANPKTTK